MAKRLSRGFVIAAAVVVVAGTAAIVALRLLTPEFSDEDRIYVPKKVKIENEIRWLQKYVQIDTQNPPGNELAGAKFLQQILNDHKVASEIIESQPGRGNLYARIEGEEEGHGLLLLHHIDVAPATTRFWTRPPFSGSLDRGLLWGRGSLDMKGIGICHLSAFLEAARRGKPKYDIVFLAVADEETGGNLGAGWLVKNRPDIFRDVEYVFNEGGITEVVGDKLTYFSIEVASRQFVHLTASSTSRDDLRALRLELEPQMPPDQPEKVLPAVREYFAGVAPNRVEGKEFLADVDATIRRGKHWLLPASNRALLTGEITMTGPKREGDRYVAKVVVASLPGDDPMLRVNDFLARARAHGVAARIDISTGRAPVSSTDTPMFDLIRRTVRNEYGHSVGVGPFVMSYATNDCRFLRSESIHCYGFSPFLIDYFHSKGIHGHNEVLRLDWFNQGIELMNKLVISYAYPDRPVA